jgi:hypothetical protein
MYYSCETRYHISFITAVDFIHMIPPITDEPSRYGFGTQRSIDELINPTVCPHIKHLRDPLMFSILVLSLNFTQPNETCHGAASIQRSQH